VVILNVTNGKIKNMLTKKTEVKPCKYGLGLFAAEPIKAGDIVWMLDVRFDRVIHKHDLQQFDQLTLNYLEKYAYTDREDRLILCIDDGKFINHSSNENNLLDFIHPVWGSITTAKRNIDIGEELTSDYSKFDHDFEKYKHLLT
jgi:SET domain-containing protein